MTKKKETVSKRKGIKVAILVTVIVGVVLFVLPLGGGRMTDGGTSFYTPMFFQPNLIIKLTESFGSKDKESLKRHFKYTYQGIVHWHPEYMEKYAKQADQFKFFAMGALQFTREQVEELLADKEA